MMLRFKESILESEEMMMKTYEFSEKSVKLAEAAHLLGFDVIEKEEIPVCQGRHMKTVVKMENVTTSCVLNNEFFPELQPGDKVLFSILCTIKSVIGSMKKLTILM